MELGRFQHIKANDFHLGFEIEACFFREGFSDFVKLLKRLDSRINVTTDGSIRPENWTRSDRYGDMVGHKGREIQTYPLKAKEGVLLLNEIFNLVSDFGYTNQTCSCHLNFSPINRKDYEKVNPFFLIQQDFWQRIRNHFNRDGNKYCQDIFLRKDVKENPVNILKHKIQNGVFWDD